MLKVGMLSAWHVHTVHYSNKVKETGLAEIVGLWDDDEARGKETAEIIGCDYYSDLDEFFSKVDAVICDAPTTQHKELIIKAAKAGKHLFTEKALATTVAECEEIADVIEETGITFGIGFMDVTSGFWRKIKEMIANGEFGTVSFIRHRFAHDGVSGGFLPDRWFNVEETGGGAMMDLGAHGMYTAHYLFGKPKRLTAMMTNPWGKSDLDEVASVNIEYGNGTIFTGETGFLSYRDPGGTVIIGSDAVYANGKFYSKALEPYVGKEGVELKFPESKPIPIVQFIEACYNGTGTPEDMTPRDAVELTRLLEAAYISDKENRTVVFD